MPPTQTTTSPRAAADQLPNARTAVPVIVLTGYLGAGKTSVLNHLLRHPAARIGVIVNDFGELNVDAGLISGQVELIPMPEREAREQCADLHIDFEDLGR